MNEISCDEIHSIGDGTHQELHVSQSVRYCRQGIGPQTRGSGAFFAAVGPGHALPKDREAFVVRFGCAGGEDAFIGDLDMGFDEFIWVGKVYSKHVRGSA